MNIKYLTHRSLRDIKQLVIEAEKIDYELEAFNNLEIYASSSKIREEVATEYFAVEGILHSIASAVKTGYKKIVEIIKRLMTAVSNYFEQSKLEKTLQLMRRSDFTNLTKTDVRVITKLSYEFYTNTVMLETLSNITSLADFENTNKLINDVKNRCNTKRFLEFLNSLESKTSNISNLYTILGSVTEEMNDSIEQDLILPKDKREVLNNGIKEFVIECKKHIDENTNSVAFSEEAYESLDKDSDIFKNKIPKFLINFENYSNKAYENAEAKMSRFIRKLENESINNGNYDTSKTLISYVNLVDALVKLIMQSRNTYIQMCIAYRNTIDRKNKKGKDE